MKFVKENMTLLICGGVALLFLVFAFAPIPFAVPTLRADLVTEMQQRYNDVTSIRQIGKQPLVLPGLETHSGVPPQTWVDAKRNMIKNINDQQIAVEKEAKDLNSRGRVEAAAKPGQPGIPLLPVPLAADLTRSAPTRMPDYLPKMTAEPMRFKDLYRQQFKSWTKLLAVNLLPGAGEEVADDMATPPKPDVLKAKWDALQAEKALHQPAGLGGVPGGGVNTAQSQRETWDFEKGEILNRASGLHMYVEQNAFQRRAWLALDAPPNEQQVFEAFVDSWFQSDLVKAILAVNAQGAPPKYDVGRAPIKRLTRVVIGNAAYARYLNTGTAGAAAAASSTPGDPGALFLTNTNAATGTEVPGAGGVTGPSVSDGNAGIAAAGAGKGGLVLPETPNATNFALGMTGRSAGHSYDVVYMSVVLDMDPAALFKFIDAFYRQNMGYTVVNVQTRTVDPLDRASAGYLYGDGQVMEVEILFQCILFRSWTAPLMPDDVKRMLGGVPPAGG